MAFVHRVICKVAGKVYPVTHYYASLVILDEAQYETEGVWDSPHIVVKRSVLDSPRHFARVLLHEIAHASSNANHGSIPFMAAIDDLAGVAAVQAISNRPSKKQPARANGRESHPRHAETRSRARKRAR